MRPLGESCAMCLAGTTEIVFQNLLRKLVVSNCCTLHRASVRTYLVDELCDKIPTDALSLRHAPFSWAEALATEGMDGSAVILSHHGRRGKLIAKPARGCNNLIRTLAHGKIERKNGQELSFSHWQQDYKNYARRTDSILSFFLYKTPTPNPTPPRALLRCF